MTKGKGKVIIWHPFPSPNGRKRSDSLALAKPTRLVTAKPQTQPELDQAAVERWAKLGDLAFGTSANPPKKKKLSA